MLPVGPAVLSRRPRQLLREQAYERLRHAILQRHLAPEQRLFDDELRSWLGMSMTPIRDALTRLSADGLVETESNRFSRVAPACTDAFHEAADFLQDIHRMVLRRALPLRTRAERTSLRRETTRLHRAAADNDPRFPHDELHAHHTLTLTLPNRHLIRAEEDASMRVPFHSVQLRRDSFWEWLRADLKDMSEALNTFDHNPWAEV